MGNSTWYDARENHPTRSEFRLYYSNSGIFQKAKESDLLIVLQKNREEIWFIIVPKGSTSEKQLIWLFGLEDLVKQRMRNGFGEDGLDVDQFISFSLSVHNRRKSRAGYSLENHLEYIFLENKILFSRGAITERKSKPDFLFPGIQYYKDATFEEQYLKMLGSKTSAKDRWRQVLPEANRIKNKHLITLEPSISLTQTDEMKEHNVTLVVPESVRSTYTEQQQTEILTLANFIEFIKGNEALAGL